MNEAEIRAKAVTINGSIPHIEAALTAARDETIEDAVKEVSRLAQIHGEKIPAFLAEQAIRRLRKDKP